MKSNLIYNFLSIFGDGFADDFFTIRILLKHLVLQKIFRINAHVPWPVHWTTTVKHPEKIQRGTRFPGYSVGCYLDGRNGIILGQNVRIGPKVNLISMNHELNEYDQFVKTEPIVIGDNCWLGTGVTILPGVRLGNHVVCAAGAVVNKSFLEDNILLAGVPAKVVKRLPKYGKN